MCCVLDERSHRRIQPDPAQFRNESLHPGMRCLAADHALHGARSSADCREDTPKHIAPATPRSAQQGNQQMRKILAHARPRFETIRRPTNARAWRPADSVKRSWISADAASREPVARCRRMRSSRLANQFAENGQKRAILRGRNPVVILIDQRVAETVEILQAAARRGRLTPADGPEPRPPFRRAARDARAGYETDAPSCRNSPDAPMVLASGLVETRKERQLWFSSCRGRRRSSL